MTPPDLFDDLSRFRIPDDWKPPPPRARKAPPRHKPGARFLKGPVPWVWLRVALRLPGRALHLGIVLWLEVGLTRSRTVKVNLSRMEDIGITRQGARRAVLSLEL